MNNKFNNKTYNNNLNISPISIFLFIFVIAFLGFGILSTYLGIRNNEIDFTIFGLLFSSTGIMLGLLFFTNIRFNFFGIMAILFSTTAIYFLTKNKQIILKIIIGYPISISTLIIGIASFFPPKNIPQDKIKKNLETYFKIEKTATKIFKPIKDIISLIIGILFTIIGISLIINAADLISRLIFLPFSLVFIYLGIGVIKIFIKTYLKK